MSMLTGTSDDTEPLVINEVSEEALNALLSSLSIVPTSDGLVNLGNISNLSSIALIGDNNQVVFLQAKPQTKLLMILMTSAYVETTECYTTYSAIRRKGERSCVHRVTSRDGTVTSTQSLCMENKGFYDDITKENYYLQCNPTQSYPKRALLYKADKTSGPTGDPVFTPKGSPIIDEK